MTIRGPDGGPIGGDALSGSGVVRGVFASNPACTPKYNTGNAQPSLQRMARLMIPLPTSLVSKFLDSVPSSAKPLARALVVANNSDGSDRGEDVATVSSAYKETSWGYIDFLLQSANENFTEKEQIVQTVSDNYVSYYLGQQPPVFNYSGVLLNSEQDDWRAAFTVMYNEILRGTKMARRKATVILAYDDVFVTGVLRQMNQTLTADTELAVRFQFSMLVKRYDTHSRISTNFQPTPVGGYPYGFEPDAFSNVAVGRVSKSIWDGGEPVYTTSQRKKDTENAGGGDDIGKYLITRPPDPETEYEASIYNYPFGMGAVIVGDSGKLEEIPLEDMDLDLFESFDDHLPPDKE